MTSKKWKVKNINPITVVGRILSWLGMTGS
ncbi:unnamed protein product [Cuscuta europaea]|uniref:Uncharacterized protein n=1 Tax=Cuscuta europaea TaxID=41803 RepID=A0A9P0YGP6_CUSEU|nr:unnamed protein product [Cuscuta europaea]